MITETLIDTGETLLSKAEYNLQTITPADWNEDNRYMSRDVSPFPGPFSYRRFPYMREIVNRFDPADPAKKIAFKKGAQVSASTGVIEAGIGYRIAVAPANMMLLTGHEDLAREAMTEKIDQMLESTGLKKLIKPNVNTKRTGDTATHKEFPGGILRAGFAGNHKLLRQRSLQVIVVDDFDAAKQSSTQSGSTQEMIEYRMAAYYSKMKLFLVSTPELKQTSNIEPAFYQGDQRYYYVPCPLCQREITLQWQHQIDEHEVAGMTWELDNQNNLISGSVGYVCPECGGFFTDRYKQDMNENGVWHPTATPAEDGFVSYHLSGLYSPPGMFDWERHVQSYLRAYPPGGNRDEAKAQAFHNLVLGETYEHEGQEPQANQIQANTRPYQIGEIPESLSQKDGNGKIVLLTCAADLNGKVEDARLDYEILAWSETGATYSIEADSIGTFIAREYELTETPDRYKYTYESSRENSVWPYFDQVISRIFNTDTGRRMKIAVTGIDAPGQFAVQAYTYIDKTNYNVVALKGKDWNKYVEAGRDVPSFRFGKERSNLYLVEVNKLKDDLSMKMALKWDPQQDTTQPAGYMNFPQPEDGKYTYKDYFSHFESEIRSIKTKRDGAGVTIRWEKKSSNAQNHFWDVAVYQIALRDIVMYWVFKQVGKKNYTWADYVKAVTKR
jgi:phage terminase large subunit GpA-like protein